MYPKLLKVKVKLKLEYTCVYHWKDDVVKLFGFLNLNVVLHKYDERYI